MSYYDDFIKSLKDKYSKNQLTNVSGALAAEITLISTFLIAALLLRHINIILTAVIIIGLVVVFITNLPLIPKLKSEHEDSLEKMIFYAVVTLGVLLAIIYWGIQ